MSSCWILFWLLGPAWALCTDGLHMITPRSHDWLWGPTWNSVHSKPSMLPPERQGMSAVSEQRPASLLRVAPVAPTFSVDIFGGSNLLCSWELAFWFLGLPPCSGFTGASGGHGSQLGARLPLTGAQTFTGGAYASTAEADIASLSTQVQAFSDKTHAE